ncbi:DNA-repair protein XRCC1 isoform X2 [Phalaenopsis equestris]|nr:DNA-repair protein XRCC1 isoform X2 [Phalaenopsis equestris]
MSSNENRSKSQKKRNDATEIMPKSDKENYTAISYDDRQNNLEFSKLLEGVVFVLSGFVNPERSTLRAQAAEMGAEYQPDWTSGCTLLICAFPNTPKFRQVENDQGTIVSKEWIFECYNHKKLVDIERYLMHVGKPWRRYTEQNQPNKVQGNVLSAEPIKRAEKSSLTVTGSQSSEGGLPRSSNNLVLPSKIKEWAADDLSKTISWLESRDEKPEAKKIKLIAAEGIMTCLQDAIDSLKQNKNIKTVTEQWMFVPHIVTYLAELEGSNLPKRELHELADSCKKIYKSEFKQLNSSAKFEKYKNEGGEEYSDETDDEGFDSDRTIEMTEEEIEFACKQIGCQ